MPVVEGAFPAFVLTLEATVFTSAQLRATVRSLAGAAQIALAGRSNVGKSSLINALGQRRRLAKTSATPGKTRSINVYRVAPQGFVLSDLPGYGYARCGREERRRWAKLLEDYLRHGGVKGLALLLDCRIPPQQSDRDLADFARAEGLPLLPLLTKADKCSLAERSRRQHEWERLGLCPLAVSAKSGLGLDEARRILCALAAGEWENAGKMPIHAAYPADNADLSDTAGEKGETMSVEAVQDVLRAHGLREAYREFSTSSATVELAAQAVGCEPGRIAKTLSFKTRQGPVLVVVMGTARIDNRKFKDCFGEKAVFPKAEELPDLVGHPAGGVCPFAVKQGVRVFLDESLRAFDPVYPAAGAPNNAVKISLADLERVTGASWISVTKSDPS